MLAIAISVLIRYKHTAISICTLSLCHIYRLGMAVGMTSFCRQVLFTSSCLLRDLLLLQNFVCKKIVDLQLHIK